MTDNDDDDDDDDNDHDDDLYMTSTYVRFLHKILLIK